MDGLFNLSLALDTVETRPTRLHDALNSPGAALVSTGLAFTVVNIKTVLEISKLTISLAELFEGRTPGFNGLGQHLTNDRNKGMNTGRGNLPSAAFWAYAGAKQRLAHIDIAQPRNDSLIQKG